LTTDSHAHGKTPLQHHFENLEQQHESATLGMWIFLGTEILFFGGILLAFAVYKWSYYEAFAAASQHQNVMLGAINTIVLIVSSLTMALAVLFSQLGKRKQLVAALIGTVALGCVFLGIKAYEYWEHVSHGLWPGASYHFPEPEFAAGARLFYLLYFGLTGLHALHMIIGVGIMAFITVWAWRGKFTPQYYSPVEVTGLYWHFVDIVWIFLFPLLYLIGRHSH
jgi:cytochrome c oxidase subunit III